MRFLLLDTCGDTGTFALAEDGGVLRESTLPARTASAQLVRAVREELEVLAWPLRTLHGVCVVNGPGSFTGVRVGLAAAKGFCEVVGLPLVTLSRLELLLDAGAAEASDLAVLDAGRGEFYVRAADANAEELLTLDELLKLAASRAGSRVLIAEERLLAALEPLHPRWTAMSAAHALTLATGRLASETENLAAVDANYVRDARALYPSGRIAPRGEGS